MFVFGVTQLVSIAAYILSAKGPSSPYYNLGPGTALDGAGFLEVIASLISIAYFAFVAILTALSGSNLINRVRFRS